MGASWAAQVFRQAGVKMSGGFLPWSHASITTLKPLESLYKQSLKTLDKKSVQFHHCSILKKYNLLSWDNLIKYVHNCLLFKTINSLFSPLKQFVNIRTTAHRSTRDGERGDCIIPFKRSNFCIFSQSCKGMELHPINN